MKKSIMIIALALLFGCIGVYPQLLSISEKGGAVFDVVDPDTANPKLTGVFIPR